MNGNLSVLKLVILICVLLSADLAYAQAQIALSTSTHSLNCSGNLTVDQDLIVYILAGSAYGLTAAEFKIANCPAPGPFGNVTVLWESPGLVIGDVWTDLSTAFSEVQWGQYVLLGTLRFNMYSQAWIGENHIMKIDNGDFCDCAIVVDGNFWTIDADKKKFTFNCTTSCDCEWTPASSETWGMIKTLY